MKAAKQFVIQTLLSDPTINGLVGRNVYASQRDFIPDLYPAMVVFDVSEKHRSVPTKARDMLIQVSIFSTKSMLEVDTIFERMVALLDTPVTATAKQALTAGSQLWWMRLENAIDVPDTTRNLWHKACTLRVWGTTN